MRIVTNMIGHGLFEDIATASSPDGASGGT